MIEETDTDIEVRKYTDAEAARELGIHAQPAAHRSIRCRLTISISMSLICARRSIPSPILLSASSLERGKARRS